MNDEDIIKYMGRLKKPDHSAEDEGSVGEIWKRLSNQPLDHDDPESQARFAERLEAYEQGLEDAKSASAENERKTTRKIIAFPSSVLAAAAVLLLSLTSVILYNGYREERSQSSELQKLLTLTLIQQNSPSQRIDGTLFASRIETPDASVHQELLRMIAKDPSTNVRLSAIQSLEPHVGNSVIRESLIELISEQESSLVAVTLCQVILPHASSAEYAKIFSEMENSSISPERIEVLRNSVQTRI